MRVTRAAVGRRPYAANRVAGAGAKDGADVLRAVHHLQQQTGQYCAEKQRPGWRLAALQVYSFTGACPQLCLQCKCRPRCTSVGSHLALFPPSASWCCLIPYERMLPPPSPFSHCMPPPPSTAPANSLNFKTQTKLRSGQQNSCSSGGFFLSPLQQSCH